MTACLLAAAVGTAMSLGSYAETLPETETEAVTEALQEEEGIISLNADQINEELYNGTWFPVEEAGVEIYLPSDWVVKAVAEEPDEEAVLYSFASEEHEGWAMVISWSDAQTMNGIDSAFELYQALAEEGSGFSDAEYGYLNGIAVATAVSEENDADLVTFFDVAGDAFTLTFVPADDEDFTPYLANMLCSLRTIEVEAVTEAETES